MHNDGKTYLWLPSCLTLSTLDAQAVAIMNTVHTAIGKPMVSVTSENPYILRLNDLDMGGAAFTRNQEPAMACSGPIENLEYLDLQYVSLIVAFGQVASQMDSRLFGDIEGLPVWFELTVDPSTIDCPLSTTTPKEKWSTWGTFGDSHRPVKLGLKWYRSNAVGESGTMLHASQWMSYRASGGTVLTVSQFKEIQSANQPQI